VKKAKEILFFFTLLTGFAVLCKRVNAFCYMIQGSVLENIFNVSFQWEGKRKVIPLCFQSSPFPGFKNHEMIEVTWRLMGLSQPKTNSCFGEGFWVR